MPQFIFANFVQTTLSATASTTDTSLSVTSAANIPALASGQKFPLTLINAATQSVYEIVYVTAVSGTTLTVLRGQEGTIAQSWSIGDLVKGSPTAGTVSPSPGTHSPVASETLPTTLGKLSVMPGTLTADITLTLPGSGDAGSETTIYGSAAAYTTTVSTGVTSGSPYIEMPDGSQVYSYVIPASSPGAGIRLDFDGTNYRATTFGPTIVAPATAANEAVNLSQVANACAPVAANANGNTATGAATTAVLTAPCDGWAIVVASFNSGDGSLNGTGVTASLAGIVAVTNPNDGNYFNQSVWYLPMKAGQGSNFTANISQSTAGVFTVAVIATFQPNPGT